MASTLYSVRDWNTVFENNRTRELVKLQWVLIPNKQDGDGYTDILSEKDGPAIFGTWVAILQIASKCVPRGTLLRETGEPHTPQSMSRMCRFPVKLIVRALPILLQVRWLESVPHETVISNPAPIPHLGTAPIPHQSRAERKKEENGIERKKEENEPPAADEVLKEFPNHLNTSRIQNRWQVWMNCRRGKSKPKSWLVLFNEQIEWLTTFDEPTAFEILSASIRNGYTGLFEPKNGKPKTQPESTQIKETLHAPKL